ncbi:MAG TPA: cell division protein FtsH, partial [Calditrichia bacterium]|nr:cell division protein FtsH [Calditrichia bacterium]
AGHALIAKLIPGSDPVHKVTIIPRGRALGVTHYLPQDESYTFSKSRAEIMLCTLMGGRVAEKIVFDQLTTGASNDIERATEIARKMVTVWGMSDRMGPLAYGKKEEEIFLGREIATHRDYSEQTAEAIDEEVSRIVREAEEKTMRLLNENREALDRLSLALLERETLDSEEIDLVLAGQELPSKSEPRRYATLKKAVTDAGGRLPGMEKTSGSGEETEGDAASEKPGDEESREPV